MCQECLHNCKVCQNSFLCDECERGFFWNTVTLQCQRCHILADLVLLVDASGSIVDKAGGKLINWNMMKNFTKNLLNRISIGKDQTRVAVIKFSNEAQEVFNLQSE